MLKEHLCPNPGRIHVRIHTTYGIACIWHRQQMHCDDLPDVSLSIGSFARRKAERRCTRVYLSFDVSHPHTSTHTHSHTRPHTPTPVPGLRCRIIEWTSVAESAEKEQPLARDGTFQNGRDDSSFFCPMNASSAPWSSPPSLTALHRLAKRSSRSLKRAFPRTVPLRRLWTHTRTRCHTHRPYPTYNSLIRAYSKGEQWEWAMEVL